MFVKILRVDGSTEFFETENFIVSKPKDMNPIIVKLTVKDNRGKTVAKWKRPNARNYMRYYKPDPAPVVRENTNVNEVVSDNIIDKLAAL